MRALRRVFPLISMKCINNYDQHRGPFYYSGSAAFEMLLILAKTHSENSEQGSVESLIVRLTVVRPFISHGSECWSTTGADEKKKEECMRR